MQKVQPHFQYDIFRVSRRCITLDFLMALRERLILKIWLLPLIPNESICQVSTCVTVAVVTPWIAVCSYSVYSMLNLSNEAYMKTFEKKLRLH